MNALRNLEIISAALATAGFRLLRAEAGSMDSGLAEFSDESRNLRVIKDRSQWILEGAQDQLEPAGLWRAFDDTEEFRHAVIAHLTL